MDDIRKKWNEIQSQIKPGQGFEKTGQSSQSTIRPSIGGTGLGNIVFTLPVDYRPEFASPDRWSYPRSIQEQLKYWRLFYAVDPIVGSTIETYVQMSLSDYQLVGKGVEGSVKTVFENMLNELNFIFMLQAMMTEFLVCGEAVINFVFDSEEGYFSDWVLIRPEDVEIVDLGLLGMENIVVYKPPKSVKEQCQLAKSAMESLKYDSEKIKGGKFFEEVVSKDTVVLEPLSSAWIPRLLHAYDTRGTSLLTRLWRVLMFEDAVFNATIQTAKRHAAPVKVVTMGDLGTGLIPTQEQVDKLLQNLAAAEVDPQAWVFVPPGTRFEAWGTTERIMSISKEYEIIERLKLLALGVSKDFITGTSTFASAQASLQVFMSRLLTFRVFFEEVFVKPKLFLTIAKANGFVLPRQADVEHNVKTQKGREYVIPEIRWSRTLRPIVNKDLLDAYDALVNSFGAKLSQRTLYDVVGLSWEDEIRKVLQESKILNILEAESKKEEELGIRFPSIGAPSLGGETLETIAPPPEAVPTPEEVEMHASKLKTDGKDDKFLVGSGQRKKYFIDTASEKDVINRLGGLRK